MREIFEITRFTKCKWLRCDINAQHEVLDLHTWNFATTLLLRPLRSIMHIFYCSTNRAKQLALHLLPSLQISSKRESSGALPSNYRSSLLLAHLIIFSPPLATPMMNATRTYWQKKSRLFKTSRWTQFNWTQFSRIRTTLAPSVGRVRHSLHGWNGLGAASSCYLL